MEETHTNGDQTATTPPSPDRETLLAAAGAQVAQRTPEQAAAIERAILQSPGRTLHAVRPGISLSSLGWLSDSILKLAQTEPGDVQGIAASQVELLSAYYRIALDQARRAFAWALVAAGVGVGFFIAAVSFLLFFDMQNLAVVSVIAGGLTQVIAGINFVLYGRAASQLADFHRRLDRTQRFLLANSIIEGMRGIARQRARAGLVRAIAGGLAAAEEKGAEDEEGDAARAAAAAGRRPAPGAKAAAKPTPKAKQLTLEEAGQEK